MAPCNRENLLTALFASASALKNLIWTLKYRAMSDPFKNGGLCARRVSTRQNEYDATQRYTRENIQGDPKRRNVKEAKTNVVSALSKN